MDFGFFHPFSIGNRVFLDDGAGGATANINNGIMDASELPIDGVRVEIYRDTNGTHDCKSAPAATSCSAPISPKRAAATSSMV